MLIMPTICFFFIIKVIIKGFWAKVGGDISTSLEMMGLQSWSIGFFLFLLHSEKE